MSERRRLMNKTKEFVWVRLDHLKNKLTWSRIRDLYNYINVSDKFPIYALAGHDGTTGYRYYIFIWFISHPLTESDIDTMQKEGTDTLNRISLNAYHELHIDYYSGTYPGTSTGRGTYSDRGWVSGQTINVDGIGLVSNLWMYESSNASKCYSGDVQAGSLLYFCRYLSSAVLSHFYALVDKQEWENN